jgi:hypothetical protein
MHIAITGNDRKRYLRIKYKILAYFYYFCTEIYLLWKQGNVKDYLMATQIMKK